MFFSKVDNPIGLDISELSVKFVQFKKLGRHLDLAVFSDVPLPQGLMNHEIISSDRGVTDFLVDLFATKSYHSGRLKGRSVVASIPESKAFVRVINLPSLLPEELETAVPIEAEQYIPLPIDQMELDWQVIAPSQEPGAGSEGLKVLITATPKEYVANLVEVLNSAGLVVQAVEAESAAIVRCLLPREGFKESTLILDMDAARTSLIVWAENSVQFTSSIPMAGNALTDAISKRLGVAPREAEHIKRLHGIPTFTPRSARVSPEVSQMMSEVTQALEPVLTNIYDEIKNIVKFHEDHNPAAQKISRIIICGGTAKLPNLSEYMQGKVAADPYFSGRNFKVELGNAWQNVVENGAPPFSRREALSYTTAIGLALRNYV